MTLEDDIAASREFEMATYLRSMKAMYQNALAQNGDVYETAFRLTGGFTRVNAEAILNDSRIIRVLRYSVAPSISQMKFGQLFGLSSLDKFENDRVVSGTQLHRQLGSIAERMSRFVEENIDESRFVWRATPRLGTALAKDYAKKWTCSIAADQNAQTAYRNWRKSQQEQAIIAALIGAGYVKSRFSGAVSRRTDINIGEYTQEKKVRGRTVQKADVVVRSRNSRRLVLIEAKAVGVELDATKRIKECCDKSNDWQSSADLGNPVVVAVIAGFFTAQNIANLRASGISIVWEHRLADLSGVW